jgi:oxygen-independent coproporphyrinogen-3 oxidase
VHIYLHVPFCARRCSYCDFAIAVAFVAAIAQEWRTSVVPPDATTDTLYFGGGTPSRLAPAGIAQLIREIGARAPLAPGAEVTLEANPDDITDAAATAWAAAGVNRVSLGVQSHDPAVLAWMHRTHRAEQVAPAVAALQQAGISNISIDLIFALPAALTRDWARDLDQTLALDPMHLSLYGLTVEPHTPLARWTERGTAVASSDERYATEYHRAHDALLAAGFDHYEVSNAGRPGFHARHNSAYWQGVDYLGLGPSAHSLSAGERRWNVRDWADYQRRTLAGEPLVAGAEQLDAAARALERQYLGLRTTAGLPLDEVAPALQAEWQRAGWAERHGCRLRLTVEGWLRLDALVAATRRS